MNDIKYVTTLEYFSSVVSSFRNMRKQLGAAKIQLKRENHLMIFVFFFPYKDAWKQNMFEPAYRSVY